MVGEGGFCRVTEISSVDLDEVYDTSEEDAVLRRGFAREVNDRGPSGGSLMSEGSGRGGGGRSFVLKTLRGDLPDDELEKGIVDLAIEAEFLAVLSHPNVIAMRAMANSDPHSGRFFVVLDRLTQTLDKKFNYWRKIVGDNAGYWFPLVGYCCAKTPTLHAIWKERMAAVLNIALAIQYLHSLGIVYRDLKPDNIGFDFSGGLKVRIATAFLQRPSPRSFPYFLSEFSLTHMSTRFLPLCKLFVDSLDFRLRLGQTGRRSGANAGWPLSSNR
jgi:serine/threonine protein kinase